MKLLFKQRMFSWFDSYDIYDEGGNVRFVVKGQPAWGHKLNVYTVDGREVACVREKIIAFLPKFEIYIGGKYVGLISRELSFFRPKYNIDFMGWQVQGDMFEWEYSVFGNTGEHIAQITKELWNWTDTYTLDVFKPQNLLAVLMLVLAIDAEKCSRRD